MYNNVTEAINKAINSEDVEILVVSSFQSETVRVVLEANLNEAIANLHRDERNRIEVRLDEVTGSIYLKYSSEKHKGNWEL